MVVISHDVFLKKMAESAADKIIKASKEAALKRIDELLGKLKTTNDEK